MGIENEFIIRELCEEDVHLLPELMMHCFKMNVSEEFFKWKFFENPAGNAIGILALDKKTNELASFCAGFPQLFCINGVRRIVYASVDNMTREKYRKKGLNKILTNKWMEISRSKSNENLFLSFPAQALIENRLRLNFRQFTKMRYYFLPKYFSFFYPQNLGNVVPITDFDQIASLLKESNNSGIFSIKDPALYRWRCSNPNFDYKTIAYKTDEYVAYLTYYVNGKTILIFDFYYKEKKYFKFLVGHLFEIVKNKKLAGIIAYVNEHSKYAKRLKKVGFISNPFSFGPLSYKRPVFILAQKEEMDILVSKKWELTAFDYDAL